MSAGVIAAHYLDAGGGGSSYFDAVMAHSPVVYLRLGDTSGTTATDSSGNGRHGTYVNTPTLGVAGLLADGDADTAVTFTSAQSEYVNLPDDPAWDMGNTFTLLAIVKTTMSGNGMILGRDGENNNRSWQFRVSSGKLQMVAMTSQGLNVTTATSATTINDGVTHHVAAVIDGSQMWVYVDGAEDGTATSLPTLSALANAIRVAGMPRSGSLTPFNGTIDEPAIIDGVLSAAQIADLFTASGL